jgi:phage shock protein PspC (stress-responsive transcriptional regulator)
MGLIAIVILCIIGLLFYFVYRVFIHFAHKSVKHSDQLHFLHGEFDDKKAGGSIEIKDWFKWNVQVNYEKGTAGGNVKINFPIKSAFLLGLLCVVIAITLFTSGITAFLLPVIFLIFAAYHFVRWYKAMSELARLKHEEQQKHIGEKEHVEISHVSKPYIAGVCSRLSAKGQIPVAVIRIFFVITAFMGGLGAVAYLLLWMLFSKN